MSSRLSGRLTRQQALTILGLGMGASESEVRSAWRKKARLFHPDSPYSDMQSFLRCQAAYETLIPPIPKSYRVRAGRRAV